MTAPNPSRQSLRATLDRTDSARDPQGRPLLRALLRNVTTPDGALVAVHAWLPWGEQMTRLRLQPGDAVEFVAEVVNGRGVTLKQPRGMVKL